MLAMAALSGDERYAGLAEEEDESVVEAICNVIRECGSDVTSEEIYARLSENA